MLKWQQNFNWCSGRATWYCSSSSWVLIWSRNLNLFILFAFLWGATCLLCSINKQKNVFTIQDREIKMHVDNIECYQHSWSEFSSVLTELACLRRSLRKSLRCKSFCWLVMHFSRMFKEFASQFFSIFVQNEADDGFADRSVADTRDCLENSLGQLW